MSAGRFNLSILLLLLTFMGLSAESRAAPVQSLVLDNGLEVYLKPIESDSDTLDLRLIIDFGAADEEIGQRGWAHLIEHMAFSGTERFSAEQIRTLLQGQTLRMGRDINAATGDEHTVFRLSVPQGDVDLLEQQLELMVDWLSAMSFSDVDLAREKRVIAAEMLETRSRRDAPLHWQDVLLSRDQNLHPAIGVMSEVQQATPESLEAFWRSGYRPGRSKLLLTGDFIPAEVLNRIHKTLSRLGSVGNPQNPSIFSKTADLTHIERVVVSESEDKPQVLLARVVEGEHQIRQMSLAMLALHLQLEMRQTPEVCGSFQRRVVTLGPESELHYLEQTVPSGEELNCLSAITTATQALAGGELSADYVQQLFHRLQSERQKHAVLEANSQVRSIAEQLALRLIKGASPITISDRWMDVAEWLAKEDSEQVAQQLTALLQPEGLSLVVQTGRTEAPTESQIARLWRLPVVERVVAQRSPGYQLAKAEATGAIEVIEESAVQRSLRYANGAQVHLLKTENISDHFDVLLVREGGLLSLPSQQVSAASRLPEAMRQSGLGSNSAADVRAGIKNHKLGLTWFVENFRQGLRASARGESAEVLFSMLHQSQQPLPSAEYQSMQARAVHVGDSSSEQGQRQLRRVIWRTLYDLGEPAGPEVPVLLDAQHFQLARDQLFSGGSDLQLYIAGDFDMQEIQALSDKYIGGLPQSADARRVPGLFASDKRRRIVHRGNEPTRADMLFYYVQSASNELERFDAELLLMREVLAQRLWQVLREREGLGYDVSLQLQRRAYQRGGSSLKVSMVCDPSFAAAVREGVDEVLLSLLVEGVDEFELAPLRHRLSADYSALLKDNAALLDEWASQRERGRSLPQVLRTVAEIEQVQSARLQQFARQFFRETGFLEVNVVPGLQADRGGEQAAFIAPTR